MNKLLIALLFLSLSVNSIAISALVVLKERDEIRSEFYQMAGKKDNYLVGYANAEARLLKICVTRLGEVAMDVGVGKPAVVTKQDILLASLKDDNFGVGGPLEDSNSDEKRR